MREELFKKEFRKQILKRLPMSDGLVVSKRYEGYEQNEDPDFIRRGVFLIDAGLDTYFRDEIFKSAIAALNKELFLQNCRFYISLWKDGKIRKVTEYPLAVYRLAKTGIQKLPDHNDKNYDAKNLSECMHSLRGADPIVMISTPDKINDDTVILPFRSKTILLCPSYGEEMRPYKLKQTVVLPLEVDLPF